LNENFSDKLLNHSKNARNRVYANRRDSCEADRNFVVMQTRTSSSSTALIVILLIITFPIWIGLAGGLFGLVVGLAGACIGIIAGIFGAIFGLIGAIFGSVFGIFDWNGYDNNGISFHFPFIKILLVVALIFFIVTISKSRKK
jgi:hypothetical protein